MAMRPTLTCRALRLFVLLVGLALAACTFQVNTTITATGAGELRSEIGFTQEDKEMLKTIATSPDKFCADAQSGGDLPEGAPVTIEERGDETWCVVTVGFASLDELTKVYSDMQGVKINALTLTPSGLTYDVDISFTGEQTEQVGADQVLFKWQVTAPGTISEHNADEVDGNTLTWNVGIGETVNARVVTTISPVEALTGGGGGLPNWVIPTVVGLCCCLLLLVAAVVVGVVVMRRRQGAAPGSAPPAA
ncbi:MAG: hypothetical protein IT317_19195 [Anaerolineales bacterium]|nr:hypothetical protein [Anaerolineales bacterium]